MRSFIYLSLALDLLILDQLSKWYVTAQIIRPHLGLEPMGLFEWLVQAGEKLPPVQIPVWPFFNIVMVWNRGVSFGMFNQETDYGPAILIALSFIIVAWFGIWLFRTRDHMQCAGIAMVIGGALGNVIDRFRFGAVIDFLDFHIAGYHWPAFNIADASIVIGVVVLIVHSFFFEKDVPSDQNL